MKGEANMKSRKWLWLMIAIVAVLAVVGVVLGIVLSAPAEEGPGDDTNSGPKGGRADIYWNIDKAMYADATTDMSSRQPGADGKYHITFAHDGEQVAYIFTDKRLVNYIDTLDAVGLVFDDKGNVVDAVDVTTIAKEMAKSFYVLKVEGNVVTLNGSATLDGLTKQITCGELTKIMNFVGARETKGELIQPEDVQPLDMVVVYGNDLDEVTHFGVMTSPVESAIYWRVEQLYDYGARMTKRVPDKDGIYTVEMFCNGELLPLKFRNVEDVNTVDKVTSDICHIGLIFDEDGYVVGTQPSQNGIRGRIACEQFDVTEINGNTFTATKRVGAANLIGDTYTGTLPKGIGIYDASAYFDLSKRGKEVGGLKLGDRITVWEDTLGNIVEIYIYIRTVSGPVYYKTDVRGTNRQPNEEGWYEIEYFGDGKIRNLKTKNEALIRWLEQNQIVGFILDGDIIKDAFSYTRVVAYDYVDYGRYPYSVSSVAGVIATLVSPDGGTMLSKIVNPDCKLYNLSGIHQKMGAETTIQVGDRGLFISDYTGQLVYAFIYERKVDAGIYYNLSRMYNGTEKCTARTPDDDGYYVFQMAHDGKVVTIKTRSKAVATKIDEIGNCIVGLKPNSKGIVTDAYRGAAATGGRVQCGGQWQFECVLEDGSIQLQRADLPKSKYKVKPADGMKVFNVSNVGLNKFGGEADKMEPGDHIQILTDANDKTVIAYIIKQTFKDVTKLCAHCNKKVTFKSWTGTNFSVMKEASGHYYVPSNGQGCSSSILGDVPKEKGDKIVIDLNGKTLEFAEGQRGFLVYNGVELNIIDSVGGGKMIAGGQDGAPGGIFTIGGNGGKLNIYGGTYVLNKKHRSITAGGVINMRGNDKTTVHLYGGKLISNDPRIEALYAGIGNIHIHSGFVIDGAMNVGNGANVNMSGTVKITKMQIQKGILVDFTKLSKKSSVGIVARGVFTTVMDDPSALLKILRCLVKGSSLMVEGKQLACYGTEPDYNKVYEQSIKMDFSNTGKLPKSCPYCDTNVVWQPLPKPDLESKRDTRVVLGGGKHYYLDKNRTVEGVYMLDGGDVCLHLNGKTITSTGREIFTVSAGKNLAVMGKGTMKGSGSNAGGYTASVISNNGGVSLCGGTYEATAKGNMPIIANRGDAGNMISIYNGTTIKTNGVAIKARYRYAAVHGGVVQGLITTEKNTSDAKVTAEIVITGGEIGRIAMNTGSLDVRAGKIENITVADASVNAVKISGAPKITELKFLADLKADVTGLTTGAEIGINKVGIFTTEFADATDATAAKGFFSAVQSGASIAAQGNVLACVGGNDPAPDELAPPPEVSYDKDKIQQIITSANAMTFPVDGSDYFAKCPHCGKTVTWIGLTDATKGMQSGHYYLAKDISVSNGDGVLFFGQWTTSATPDVCLHLNGKKLINAKSAGLAAIRVWTNYNLTIMGKGKVDASGADWGVLDIAASNAVVNVYGGNYSSSSNYRTFHVKKGTLNVHNAKIENGLIYISDVSGAAKVNLYNGEYREICMDDPSDALTISGGTCNKITATGALYIKGGTFTQIIGSAGSSIISVSGKPVINELDMTDCNIKLTAGELKTDASIRVKAKEGIFTKDFTDADAATAAKAFFTGVSGKVAVEGKALAFTPTTQPGGSGGGTEPDPGNGGGGGTQPDPGPVVLTPEQIVAAANAMTFPTDGTDKVAQCPRCGVSVTWKALKDTADDATHTINGHYYLSEDLADGRTAETMVVSANGKLCLHLNGKCVNAATSGGWSAAIRGNVAGLNILGNGTVKGNASAAIWANGPTNIYGGTYTASNAHAVFELRGAAGEAINFYAGNITSGDVRMNGGNAAFNMHGGVYSGSGRIKGNQAKTGMTVTIYEGAEITATKGITTCHINLDIRGGHISTVVTCADTKSFKLSGEPVITELDMSNVGESGLIQVGELGQNASIAVKANGVFTNDIADVNAAMAFFSAAANGKKIDIVGQKLTCVDAA